MDIQTPDGTSSKHSPGGLQRAHGKSNALRCRCDGGRSQFRDQPQDVSE